MYDCFFFFPKSKLKCEIDPRKLLLNINDDGGGDYDAAAVQLRNPTAEMALLLRSWLNGRRLRYLILALCLPLIVPILCVSFPVICAVEICFHFCLRKRCRMKSVPPPYDDEEEGGGGEVVVVVVEVNLLERYLDDQLGLALEFTCEFDSDNDDDDDETDDIYRDKRSSNLVC